MMEIKKLTEKENKDAVEIWNTVVADGEAFPQTEELDEDQRQKFFCTAVLYRRGPG